MYKYILSWLIIFLISIYPLEKISEYVIKNNIAQGIRGTSISEEDLYYLKYIEKVHHVRDIVQWSSFTGGLDNYNNLLFSIINNFNAKQENTILINGDSWAEMTFWKSVPKKILKSYSKENKIKIVVSGISSFSASPMTIQLKILREDFNIRPDNIVSFFDYTDFGDELCRYKSKLIYEEDTLLLVKPETYESREVYSDLTLLKNKFEIYYNKNYFNLQKLFYYGIERLKYIFTKKIEDKKCGWQNIAQPLVDGLNDNELDHIHKVINEYLRQVFRDNKTKKLYIVVHPHKNHFYNKNAADKYKLFWSPILKNIIKESKFENKIEIIDFNQFYPSIYNKENIKTEDIFIKNDISSHLIEDAHGIMIKKVLSIMEKDE